MDQNSQKTNEMLKQEVEQVLATLREGLAMHAGDVSLVDADVETGVVKVRLLGTCVGCPMSDMTLKMGIEETLCQMIPEVRLVERVE